MGDVITDTQPSDMQEIALQIKSLEQRTTSVTLPRNASVLQLKQEIQIAFDVQSNRQRLIFQGKVLKDDKKLGDYANLDNGKVIHLVIRPEDAPNNPLNDDPNLGTANARHARALPFPNLTNRSPMMEGYAFITLDSTLGETSNYSPFISALLNGTGPDNTTRASSPTTADTTSNNSTTQTNRPINATRLGLLRQALNFGHRGSSGEQRSPLASSGLGYPPSAEVRLARTLASMRNVRTMLSESSTSEDIPTSGVNSTPEQLQEIRNRLQNNGGTQLSQVGMTLDELADLAMETVPRLREVAQMLREETTGDENDRSRHVIFMSRVIQGMSLINHFMGSVLATVDIDSRRSRSHNSNVRQTSRGETQALRTTAPTVISTESSASTSGSKRKSDEEKTDDPIKKSKQEKGKEKDKTD